MGESFIHQEMVIRDEIVQMNNKQINMIFETIVCFLVLHCFQLICHEIHNTFFQKNSIQCEY